MASLVKPVELAWLIHPPEVSEALRERARALSSSHRLAA